MKYLNLLIFTVAGFVSGFISDYLSDYLSVYEFYDMFVYTTSNEFKSLYVYAPGLIFGILLLLAFLIYKRSVLFSFKYIAWLVMSTISFWVAIQTLLHNPLLSIEWIDGIGALIIIVFTAGVIGSLIMVISFHYLLSPLKFIQFIILVLLGGLLSLGIVYWFTQDPDAQNSYFNISLFMLFISWQTCMATTIGFFVDRNYSHAS